MRLWCLPTYSGFIFDVSYDTHFMYLLQMVKCSGERTQGQNHSEAWSKYVRRQNAKRKKATSLNVLKKQSLKFNARPLRIAALSAPRPACRWDARQTQPSLAIVCPFGRCCCMERSISSLNCWKEAPLASYNEGEEVAAEAVREVLYWQRNWYASLRNLTQVCTCWFFFKASLFVRCSYDPGRCIIIWNM